MMFVYIGHGKIVFYKGSEQYERTINSVVSFFYIDSGLASVHIISLEVLFLSKRSITILKRW